VTAGDVAFTFNYIVDNELLNLSTYTNGITGAEVIDDTHVKVFTSAPKANMLRMVVPILPEHIWSKVSGKAATTSYQNKPPGGDHQLPEQAADRRQRALPARGVEEGQVRTFRGEPGLLGR